MDMLEPLALFVLTTMQPSGLADELNGLITLYCVDFPILCQSVGSSPVDVTSPGAQESTMAENTTRNIVQKVRTIISLGKPLVQSIFISFSPFRGDRKPRLHAWCYGLPPSYDLCVGSHRIPPCSIGLPYPHCLL